MDLFLINSYLIKNHTQNAQNVKTQNNVIDLQIVKDQLISNYTEKYSEVIKSQKYKIAFLHFAEPDWSTIKEEEKEQLMSEFNGAGVSFRGKKTNFQKRMGFILLHQEPLSFTISQPDFEQIIKSLNDDQNVKGFMYIIRKMLAHYQGHSQLKKGLQIVSSTQISNHNTLSQYNESSTFLTDGSLHFIQVIDEILSVELNNDSKDTNFKEQLDNSISTQQLTLVNHDEYYYTELQEKEGLNKNDTIKKLIIFKFESLKIGNLINYENSKTSNYWQYNGIFNNCLLLCFDDYQYDDSIMRTIIARLDEENDMLLSEKRRSKNKKISIYSGLEQRFVNYLLSDNQLTGNQQRSQFKQLFFPSEMESIGLQSSQILRSQTHTSQY